MRTLMIGLIGILAVGIVACGPAPSQHMDGSRHELFDSVRSISAASSNVVVVEVRSQTEENGPQIPYTISDAKVLTQFAPAGLGSALGLKAPRAISGEVAVRQMGSKDVSTPAPILETGRQYLLFLTPSMLEGEAAVQFSVTGGSAGIYSVESGEFVHGPFTEGDTLPEALTAADLRG